MTGISARAHGGLPWANPLSEDAMNAVVAGLDLPADGRVLDTGCGNGEILLRLLEAHPHVRGVGIDLDPAVIADAQAAAAERLPGRAIEFLEGDADALAGSLGRFDLAINIGSSHAHGGFPPALERLKSFLQPTGLLLFGEGFWSREPSAEFLDALGGATRDELPDHDGLLSGARDAGFTVLRTNVAGSEDWACYEETLAENAEKIDGEEAAAYARQIRTRRALAHGADTLGFALLVLRA